MTQLATCGFCGFEFDPNQAETACTACPLSRGCHLVCCPRCGYQMPPEARLVGWLRNLRQGRSAEKKPSPPTFQTETIRKETFDATE